MQFDVQTNGISLTESLEAMPKNTSRYLAITKLKLMTNSCYIMSRNIDCH